MTTTVCTLEADGFVVHWYFRQSDIANSTLIVTAELLINIQSESQTIRTQEFAMTHVDLRAMGEYLDRHMSALRMDPSHQSDTFLRYDLGYQLEASAGDIDAEGNGEFELTLLLNIGFSASRRRVYVGSRGPVSFKSVAAFVATTRTMLKNLP
jgi:hypothetical protein